MTGVTAKMFCLLRGFPGGPPNPEHGAPAAVAGQHVRCGGGALPHPGSAVFLFFVNGVAVLMAFDCRSHVLRFLVLVSLFRGSHHRIRSGALAQSASLLKHESTPNFPDQSAL